MAKIQDVAQVLGGLIPTFMYTQNHRISHDSTITYDASAFGWSDVMGNDKIGTR